MKTASDCRRWAPTAEAARRPRAPRRAVAGLCVAWLVVASPAAGKDLAQVAALAPGMRVRVTAPGSADPAVAGTIRALDADVISLEVQGRSEPLGVPRIRIARLELSAGRRSRLIGALIGAVVGGGLGALAGKASTTRQPYELASVNEAAGAMAGALVGSIVGALVPPGERWNDVTMSRYRISLAPRVDRAVGASMALAF